MKEQIEEMRDIITTDCDGKCVGCEFENDEWCFTHFAVKALYNAGYRKQKEGAWIWTENGEEDYEQYWVCSCCHEKSYWKSKFCSDCGAKMKGGAE